MRFGGLVFFAPGLAGRWPEPVHGATLSCSAVAVVCRLKATGSSWCGSGGATLQLPSPSLRQKCVTCRVRDYYFPPPPCWFCSWISWQIFFLWRWRVCTHPRSKLCDPFFCCPLLTTSRLPAPGSQVLLRSELQMAPNVLRNLSANSAPPPAFRNL